MNRKPGKGNFRELKSKKLPGSVYPRAPLKAFSLGPSFRKSVSIYPLDPHLIHLCRLDEWDMACAGILPCHRRFLSGIARFSITLIFKFKYTENETKEQ